MSSRPRPRRARREPPPPPDTLSVRGITMPCLHLVRTATFYTATVGLPILGRSSRHVSLDADGVRLVLVDASRSAGFARGKSQTMFLELAVPDLAGVERALTAAGAKVVSAATNKEGGMLSTRDPEGNVLNLVGKA